MKNSKNRISKKVLENLKSIDDLIDLMKFYGHNQNSKEENREIFKSQLSQFKTFLEKEFPELTIEEILKFDSLFQRFKKIYDFSNHYNFLTAIEFEHIAK